MSGFIDPNDRDQYEVNRHSSHRLLRYRLSGSVARYDRRVFLKGVGVPVHVGRMHGRLTDENSRKEPSYLRTCGLDVQEVGEVRISS